MCFDEYVFSSSCNVTVWATDSPFLVYIAILVLDEAQVIIFRVVAMGNIAVVNGDVAVVFSSSRCRTGVNKASWGEQGHVGQFLDCHLEFLGGQGHSIK